MQIHQRRWRFLVSLSLWCAPAFAQSTESLISGRVLDAEQGTAIAGARVSYLSLATNTGGEVMSGASGYYVAPLLPPGKYRLRVTSGKYQAQELHELDLPVASSLEVNFRLRPLSDIWEQGQYRSVFLPGTKSVLPFYGPDVDSTHLALLGPNQGNASPLETSISTVIDPVEISELPLSGRDVYATLVLQPGVAADTTTARGLGYSVNGQRPSSSNYLLDGVENNNYLVTGPLTAVAPEAVQEYRLSTSGFSAEYGGTAGFVANAVTRSGGNQWHGIGYFEFENDVLDANGFQGNANGNSRPPFKQDEPGFQVGGPILKNTLFESLAVDYLRSRSFGSPFPFVFPATNFLSSDFVAPGSIAAYLLQKYPAPAVAPNPAYCAGLCGMLSLSPPADVDRLLGLERVDYVKGAQRIMARLVVSLVSQADFIWSPYSAFDAPLNDNSAGLALAWTRSLRPGVTNELRGSISSDDLYWNRPHAEIPTLMAGPVALPGSFAEYAYRDHSHNFELLDNILWSKGAHIVKAGAGLLLRRLDGYLTEGRDGAYEFDSILDFGANSPTGLEVGLDQLALSGASPQSVIPNYNRQYSYNQYSFFMQDSFKASPRLTLNYGVRYENFGSPQVTGPVKDAIVQLGPGTGFPQELAGAQLTYPQQGNQSLYAAGNRDWSVRPGFAYSLRQDSRTVLRGGYGIFYDRPFDNLWQNLANNNVVLAQAPLNAVSTNYLAPVASVLPGLSFTPVSTNLPPLTLYQSNIKSAYAQDYFLEIQQEVTHSFTLEVNGAGSLGRRLITTDIVNRIYSVPVNLTSNPYGYQNPSLPEISYRGNEGASDYNALTVTGRYHTRRAQFQVAYTWSHAIDNQSDPLLGDFFNLSFTGPGASASATSPPAIATFTRQFDSASDRGNSDFDQRHNLVFYSIWELPAVFTGSRFAPAFRNWRVSEVGAIRSGFPFTVYGYAGTEPASGGDFLPQNRADLIDPAAAIINTPANGGRQLLNSMAFEEPPANTLGNTGRNEFRGPGLYSIDVSLSRGFPVAMLGEAGRLILRADAYNALNHTNLNSPLDTFAGSGPGFGTALYGRLDSSSGFPALTPLNETARQVQLMLRVVF